MRRKDGVSRFLRWAKMVVKSWLAHSSLPSSMDRAKDMSEGSVSTSSAFRKPTRFGYVVKLYTCMVVKMHVFKTCKLLQQEGDTWGYEDSMPASYKILLTANGIMKASWQLLSHCQRCVRSSKCTCWVAGCWVGEAIVLCKCNCGARRCVDDTISNSWHTSMYPSGNLL